MDTSTNQFTLLNFANTRLALPLSEVVTIERARQIQPDAVAQGRLGEVAHGGYDYPVYGFSPAFELLPHLPAERLFCVCLQAGESGVKLALTCDTTMPLRLEQSERVQALPACMQRGDTPLQGLCKHGQHLLLFSTTTVLANYIKRMESHYERAC